MSQKKSLPPSPSNPDLTAFGPVALFYDELMAGVPYQFWVEYAERVWAAHALSPRRILDLACGTGTVARLLARRGYEVVGVDLSGPMLDAARAQSQSENVSIPFHQQDAAELHLPGQTFDACVSLFDSLNYILEPERLAEAFRRVAVQLAPGGAFLFDLNTEYALAEGMFNQSCTRRDAPLHYRWRSRYNAETRLCTVHMRFSRDNDDGGEREVFTEIHRQRGHSKDEVLDWLRAAGFAQTFVYDAYTLDGPKKRSDRLFYLGVLPHV